MNDVSSLNLLVKEKGIIMMGNKYDFKKYEWISKVSFL